MKSLVIYYSLSGTTRTLAMPLARELGADLAEIWRAAFDSLRRRSVPIEPLERQPSEYDLIIIGGPIWAGHIATPVRNFAAGTGPKIVERGVLPHTWWLTGGTLTS